MRGWLAGIGASVAGLAVVLAASLTGATTEPEVVIVPPMLANLPAATGPALVFASFNVCKVDCEAPAPSWDVRRDRVARSIVESSPDVVGLQEVTHWATTHAKTQFLDLQSLIAPHGFVAVEFTKESDECRWTAENPHPCTHTTGLVFQSRTVEQVATPNGTPSAGTLAMARIGGALTADAASRKVTWAYLRGRNGAGPFLALSVHTSTFKDPANEAARVSFGQALDAWIDVHNAAHGMSGVPVVLLADLNSYARRQPQGVQRVLTDLGWLDAATAPVRRNVQYSTINVNPRLPAAQQGFPASPYVFRTTRSRPVLDATRIDYIMAKGDGVAVLDYEVVIRLRSDGSFDPAYQGSDHQMVRATVVLPAR